MKRIILLNLYLVISLTSIGQTFEESYKETVRNYKNKNYKETIKNLNDAQKAIEKQYLQTITKDIFPKVINGIKVNQKENIKNNQSFISGNKIQIHQKYEPENNEATTDILANGSSISIMVSNFPEKVCEFINSYAMAENETINMAESFVAERINDYRTLIQYDNNSKNGRIVTHLGGAVLDINAENVEDEDKLKEIANQINKEKIIKYFGK